VRVATGTYTFPATLVSIAVTPAYVSIPKGSTQQFTATGTYSDSSTQNLTSSVTWSSTNTSVATITSAGLATGAATGSATIQATSGSISGSTSLTVVQVLVSDCGGPANASLAKSSTQQFTATGVLSDGSTLNPNQFRDLDVDEHGGGDDHELGISDGRGGGQHDDSGDLGGDKRQHRPDGYSADA